MRPSPAITNRIARDYCRTASYDNGVNPYDPELFSGKRTWTNLVFFLVHTHFEEDPDDPDITPDEMLEFQLLAARLAMKFRHLQP